MLVFCCRNLFLFSEIQHILRFRYHCVDWISCNFNFMSVIQAAFRKRKTSCQFDPHNNYHHIIISLSGFMSILYQGIIPVRTCAESVIGIKPEKRRNREYKDIKVMSDDIINSHLIKLKLNFLLHPLIYFKTEPLFFGVYHVFFLKLNDSVSIVLGIFLIIIMIEYVMHKVCINLIKRKN